MVYTNIIEGIFINRINRFIAQVSIQNTIELCHVRNTGRCKELLIPGVKVYVEKNNNPARKTRYSLIHVEKGELLINMDSTAPNKVVHEWLKKGNLFPPEALIKPESAYRNSRFDFYIEYEDRRAYMEVKGVTLEEEGIARFPDAPTERGVKHIYELCQAVEEGYEAYIFFVIQMKPINYFTPNDRTHREFGEALRQANKAGVHILAYDCNVTDMTLDIDKQVEISL